MCIVESVRINALYGVGTWITKHIFSTNDYKSGASMQKAYQGRKNNTNYKLNLFTPFFYTCTPLSMSPNFNLCDHIHCL